MRRRWGLVLSICLSSPAWSSLITYDVINVAGNTWRYDYTIVNDTLLTSISEFTIYFDLGQYSNLGSPSGPSTWDVIAIDPDSGLPADGFFDALVLDVSDAMAPGGTLGGFSVTFDFLGAGTPGSQLFEFYTDQLGLLDEGRTQRLATAVPEPPSDGLMLLGVAALVALRRIQTKGSRDWRQRT